MSRLRSESRDKVFHQPGVNGTAPANPATDQQNAQARGTGQAKKPAPQQVQQAKSQVANFKAQPKPQQVPTVTFNQNHRIEGSDHWEGQRYQVFRHISRNGTIRDGITRTTTMWCSSVAVIISLITATGFRRGVTALQHNIIRMTDRSTLVTVLSRRIK